METARDPNEAEEGREMNSQEREREKEDLNDQENKMSLLPLGNINLKDKKIQVVFFFDVMKTKGSDVHPAPFGPLSWRFR